MEDDIRTLLDEVIKSEIKNLNTLTPGSLEHEKAAEDIAKLYKLRIDEAKLDSDECEKRDQKSERAIDRYIKLGVEIAGIILPLVFYGNWMRAGFEFESKGAFTSTTFMGLFRHFRPNKK